jgi:hypothetical protein
MPPVPRIDDEYLDCAIYLYASEGDAEAGKRSGGSGFLVGILTDDLPSNVWIIYAVTNKHVVQRGNSVIRVRTKDGVHSVKPIDERAWMYHPDGDDLAVCPVQFDWDALKCSLIKRDVFLDKAMAARFNIGVGDEAFVVGRFINHEGRQQNLPTARFGCIAQMPIEPVKQSGTGFDQESFLVEIRSIGGYSGSPVFVHIPKFSVRSGVEGWHSSASQEEDRSGNQEEGVAYPPEIASRAKLEDVGKSLETVFAKNWGHLNAHGPWLLGVDWGHINDWQPVCDAAGNPVDRDGPPWKTQVRMNTGIMTVIPAWKLIDMLDEGPIAEQRKQMIEEIRQRQEADPPPIATLD